ncbi:MAG: decarboxylase [Nanoarchaeota archaeon]|nr:decarboxylase [Nanoarchaeota archaeon]
MTNAKFVLSKSKVIEQYNKIKQISDIVSYSVKTNPIVAEILEEKTKCFFTIHFISSLEHVKNKKRVWFFAQAWKDKELDILFEKDVENFVVDNENDLKILLDYTKKNNKKINLLLRMRLKENTIRTGKHYVYGLYSSQVNELIPKLRKNNNINKLGIHFHRKTQNISEWSLKYELSESIPEEIIKQIDIVNIGGGIPVSYRNYTEDLSPQIFKKIRELKDWLHNYNIKMIVEPGRFIAGPGIKLEAEIVNIYNNNIVINCSVFNSAMDTFVADIRLLVEGELKQGTPYVIKGCTPDSMDIFRYRVYLENPKVGDKIIFLNAGAYTYSTDFCNLKKLETVIVD